MARVIYAHFHNHKTEKKITINYVKVKKNDNAPDPNSGNDHSPGVERHPC